MVAVRINGADSGINSSRLVKVADLIELIKSMIDPDHMITALLLDGKPLDEPDWTASLTQFGTAILEVETDTPDSFVRSRFLKADEIVRSCFLEFRDCRKSFQSGDMTEGNQKLLRAVNTARAFFDWYGSLLQLVPAEQRGNYDISKQVEEISEVCKRICQQQLYQSWWALGETLEKELEPKLDQLEDFCRNLKKMV